MDSYVSSYNEPFNKNSKRRSLIYINLHLDDEAVGTRTSCRQLICRECSIEVQGKKAKWFAVSASVQAKLTWLLRLIFLAPPKNAVLL